MGDWINPILFFLILTLSIGFAIYKYQNRLVYFPDMPTKRELMLMRPDQVGVEKYEDIWIEASDGVKSHALLLFAANSRHAPTMLYFHGNAGNISHRLPNAARFVNDHRIGCNVLLVQLRGYGLSEGEAKENGMKLDGQAALDYVKARDDLNGPIWLFGRSLGGAMAVYLASKNDLDAVILENTFTSIPDMIDVVLPAFSFIKPLCHIKWDSFSIIADVKAPILFISGRKDELVPPAFMDKLYERATAKKTMMKMENGTHNETWTLPLYYTDVSNALEELDLV